MIPTECPVTRAFTFYISLILITISIYYLMESTSYFPNSKYKLILFNNHLEIQARGFTPDLTPYYENEALSISHPNPNSKSSEFGSDSPTLDSEWGI